MSQPSRVLVANRGEIARRVIRTCHAQGIATVAVYSDADAGSPHVREADVAVRLGPAAASASYLDAAAILAAARRTGADAVHPGYGFLAENGDFAQAVIDAGLIWIGPPPEAMRAMGDKVAARELADRAGVPTVPGYDGSDASDGAFAEAAERIGYPVLVKAAAGGGGRGMRRVDEAGGLSEALASARREAAASFGDATVFLERYVARPRHIEVQVFADSHGTVVHLGERECSVQRRHQKIVEEAPSPVVDDALRQRLGDAAIAVARAGGYVGAGTAEFLVDGDRFYFLELNARLQVEHPVTEEVTGLDLVALQLAVAAGDPLPAALSEVQLSGHAIEVRVYAEDPMRGDLPSAGRLVRVDLGGGEGVRIDAGYVGGDSVGVSYDSMLGKIIARGATRAQALRRLRRAVDRAWVPGVVTNLPLLRQILAVEAFAAGDMDTHFLQTHGLPQAPPLNLERGALAATAFAHSLRAAAASVPVATLGLRLEGMAIESDAWACGSEQIRTWWRRDGSAPGGLQVRVGSEEAPWQQVDVGALEGDCLPLVVDGVHRVVRLARRDPVGPVVADGEVIYLHFGDAEAMVSLVPRFAPPKTAADEPGSCSAPTPGTVVKVKVAAGDTVSKGQVLVVLEAMKMEHSVAASADGTVAAVLVGEGDTVDEGTLLVRLDETEPPVAPE